LLILSVLKIKSFRLTGCVTAIRLDLNMRWSFTNSIFSSGDPHISDFCGADGAFYYHPSIKAKLKHGNMGELLTLPIFPSTGKVLVPLGTETLNVFEMRHRELFSRVQDKYFAFSHVSQQKLSLLGTIARVINSKLCDDGRFYATVEGIERFYISDIKSDKPYISGSVQIFYDTCSNIKLVEELENKLYNQVRINIKLMHLISSKKKYTFYPNIFLYRPHSSEFKNIRVANVDEKNILERRTKFSFAVMDILQISSSQKLFLLQEFVLERRYAKLLSLLEKSELHLTDELKNKGVITNEGISSLKREVLNHDYYNRMESNDFLTESYIQNEDKWIQQSILM